MKRVVLGILLALSFAAMAQSSYGTFRVTVMTLAADASTPCPPQPMNSRSDIRLQSLDSANIWIGGYEPLDAGINANNGFPLLPDASVSFHSSYSSQTGAGQTWCYSVAGTIDGGLRIIESR